MSRQANPALKHRFEVGTEVTMGPSTLFNGRKAIIKAQLPGVCLPNYTVVLKGTKEELWAVEIDFVEVNNGAGS